VAEVDARGLVIVDDADLAADQLGEPDGGGVADAEVPGGPHQRGALVRPAGRCAWARLANHDTQV
jgi:hypothetical protein